MIKYPITVNKKAIGAISSRNITPHKPLILSFQRGERFTGLILKIVGDGRVTVSAKGSIFSAKAHGALAPGKTYQFLVSRTEPYIELKVLPEASAQAKSLFHIWASTQTHRKGFVHVFQDLLRLGHAAKGLPKGISGALEELAGLWPKIIYEGVGAKDATWVSQCLMASGLFWENKLSRLAFSKGGKGGGQAYLGDLKGLLLRIIGELEGVDRCGTEEVAILERAKRTLHLIEMHQAMNLEALEKGMGWYWFIPLVDDGESGEAQLLGKEYPDKGHTMWITVRLSHLGQMQVILNLKGRNVRVQFFMADQKRAQLVSENIQSFKQSLEHRGLSLEAVICSVKERDEMAYRLARGGQEASIHMKV